MATGDWMLLLLVWLEAASALIAYDCRTPSANISAVSLHDVQPCEPIEEGYETTEVPIQVVEKERLELAHVRTCLIEVHRVITYCGMHSHSSIVDGGVLTYVHRVGAEECAKMHDHSEYRGLGGHVIGRLSSNATASVSLTLAGSLSGNGACSGTTYHENGRSWGGVVVVADVKITMQDYYATVNLDTSEVTLRDGVRCPYLEGYCLDFERGETVWAPHKNDDCDRQKILFHGLALKVKEKLTGQPENEYIVVEQAGQVFALKLIRKERLCSFEAWKTEHPRLLVAFGDQVVFTRDTVRDPRDADLLTYVNSKFLYVEQSYRKNVHRVYKDALYRRCLMHREVLKNRLLMAQTAPNAVSALVKNRLGYVGKVAGEVLYIFECLAVSVTVERLDSCYDELPVRYRNKTHFMSPVTRVLQEQGQSVPCSALIPSMYFVDGMWLGFGPGPISSVKPQTLKPDGEPTLAFSAVQDVGNGGVYTSDEIRKAQDVMMFGMEKKAIGEMLVSKVAGRQVNSNGFSTLNIFGEAEIEKIASSTAERLFGWFSFFGNWVSGFLGLYFAVRILKFVLEVLINAVTLHRAGGWSFHLLGAVWDSLTWLILHNNARNGPNAERRNGDDDEDFPPPHTVRVTQSTGQYGFITADEGGQGRSDLYPELH